MTCGRPDGDSLVLRRTVRANNLRAGGVRAHASDTGSRLQRHVGRCVRTSQVSYSSSGISIVNSIYVQYVRWIGNKNNSRAQRICHGSRHVRYGPYSRKARAAASWASESDCIKTPRLDYYMRRLNRWNGSWNVLTSSILSGLSCCLPQYSSSSSLHIAPVPYIIFL